MSSMFKPVQQLGSLAGNTWVLQELADARVAASKITPLAGTLVSNKVKGTGVASMVAGMPDELTAAYAAFRAPPETIYNVMRSAEPVTRRRFMAYTAGTGGKAVKEVLEPHQRTALAAIGKMEKFTAPLTSRYGTISPVENPATYAMLYRMAPNHMRPSLRKWMIGGGIASGGTLAGTAAYEATGR